MTDRSGNPVLGSAEMTNRELATEAIHLATAHPSDEPLIALLHGVCAVAHAVLSLGEPTRTDSAPAPMPALEAEIGQWERQAEHAQQYLNDLTPAAAYALALRHCARTARAAIRDNSEAGPVMRGGVTL
ncbi:MAG TPA: hypothetical protein VGG54_22500 [Trebonia sp.]|jgi:hypothetical protein